MRPNTSVSGIFSTKRNSPVSTSMLTRMLVPKPKNAFQSPGVHNTGSLRETLFEYRSAPSLRPGYSHSADEKTAYAKIVVICRALTEANFQNILSLHRHLVKKYSRSFETLYKQA